MTQNKKIDYDFNILYTLGNGYITCLQTRNSKVYEDLKKKGSSEFVDIFKESQKIKGTALNICGKEVFKYDTYKKTEDNKQLKQENYIWKEDGFYCNLLIKMKVDNPDDIAKEFIKSNPIK